MTKGFSAESSLFQCGMNHNVSAFGQTMIEAVEKLKQHGNYIFIFEADQDENGGVTIDPDSPVFCIKGHEELDKFYFLAGKNDHFKES